MRMDVEYRYLENDSDQIVQGMENILDHDVAHELLYE